MTVLLSALLSLEDSRLARPLRAWPDALQAEVLERVGGCLTIWRREYGLIEPEDYEIQILAIPSKGPSIADPDLGWNPAPLPIPGLWFRPSQGCDAPRSIARELFGECPEGTLAEQVAQQVWQALWDGLGKLFPHCPEPTSSLRDCLTLWSGALLLRVPCPPRHLDICIAPEHLAALLPEATARRIPEAALPMRPLLPALGKQPVALSVELSSFEVHLEQLVDLRQGDILCTPHPLEQPVLVRGESAAPLMHAFLGRQGDRRAIELLPANATSSRLQP